MDTLAHFNLNLPIGRIHGVRTSQARPVKVLCLHGWLDNHASFLPMMPFMQGVECVAVDMIGHGKSDHRDANSLYHYIDYIRDIKLIINALGWQRCHLVGHSMGGAIALITASALSEHIQSLSLIDILHPLTRSPAESPKLLAKALKQFEYWDVEREKIFPSLKHAVIARLAASPFPQRKQDASLLMQHATDVVDTGLRLRSDARLSFRSPLMLDNAQVEAFIQAVDMPSLAILATQGMTYQRTDVKVTLALFQTIEAH